MPPRKKHAANQELPDITQEKKSLFLKQRRLLVDYLLQDPHVFDIFFQVDEACSDKERLINIILWITSNEKLSCYFFLQLEKLSDIICEQSHIEEVDAAQPCAKKLPINIPQLLSMFNLFTWNKKANTISQDKLLCGKSLMSAIDKNKYVPEKQFLSQEEIKVKIIEIVDQKDIAQIGNIIDVCNKILCNLLVVHKLQNAEIFDVITFFAPEQRALLQLDLWINIQNEQQFSHNLQIECGESPKMTKYMEFLSEQVIILRQWLATEDIPDEHIGHSRKILLSKLLKKYQPFFAKQCETPSTSFVLEGEQSLLSDKREDSLSISDS